MPIATHMKTSRTPTTTHAITNAMSGADLLDRRGEVDVALTQTALVVRGERDPDLAPSNVEIGVVVRLLGEEADADHEPDRVGERRALVGLHDLVAVARPPGKAFEGGCNLGVGKLAHGRLRGFEHPLTTRNTIQPDHHSTPGARTRHTRVVAMDLPEAEPPTKVELDREHGLVVEWADGTGARFGLVELRVNCPCAECRERREQGLEA